MVQKKDTLSVYAAKQMSKKYIKFKSWTNVCLTELDVLSRVQSQFILDLKYAFHDEENMYLVVDLCTGGDLRYHMTTCEGLRLPFERAQFYAAEVLLGLESLHKIGYVYRDLKPSNVLLDFQGWLVWFGLIDRAAQSTHTQGTPSCRIWGRRPTSTDWLNRYSSELGPQDIGHLKSSRYEAPPTPVTCGAGGFSSTRFWLARYGFHSFSRKKGRKKEVTNNCKSVPNASAARVPAIGAPLEETRR